MTSVVRRVARAVLPAPIKRAIKASRPASGRENPPRTVDAGPKRRNSTLWSIAAGRRAPSATLGVDEVVAETHELLEDGEHAVVISAAEALRRTEATYALGSLVAAIVAFRRGFRESTWAYLGDVPVSLWSRYAMLEYVLAGIDRDPATVKRELFALAESPAAQVGPEAWFEASSHIFGLGETELARALYERFDRSVEDATDPDKKVAQNRDWMRPWVAAAPDSPSAPAVPEGHISFAIMDYGHPGRSRASANIGDHIQSIASLGHVVRRQGISFHGEEDLVGLLDRLAERVPDELRLQGAAADVDVLTLDRDASMYSAIPPNTWTLGFGWFMHPIYEVRCGFPFHSNLLPIFLSFHCSQRELLTPEAAAYLKQYGPIGCRDWTTVDILLSMGVPAFFSGCLTTTVSTAFPKLEEKPSPDAPAAYVDMPEDAIPAGAPTYKHSDDAVRFRSFVRNVDDAVDLLETYRREYSAVVTSRLHAYLPSRSLGMEVDFQPKNRSDPRFEGLMDITDEQVHAIRLGIMDKLSTVLERIFAGDSADAVYALWAEITVDEVAYARERHVAPVTVPSLNEDVWGEAAACAAAAVHVADGSSDRAGEPIELVVHGETQGLGRLSKGLSALIASITGSTSRPVHLTLLSRLPKPLDAADLAELVPEVSVDVVSTVGLGSSIRRPNGRPIPARDIDLAMLPDLLPDLARVVVLPTDAVVRGDLGELYDLDLGERHVAAPTTRGRNGASGFGLIHTAAGRLRDNTRPAAELRRIAHARHAFDFDSLTTDILILDLAALREAGFVSEFVPYMSAFGLGLRELLCVYAGPDRAAVPPEWDVVPTRELADAPQLLHWADSLKPWHKKVVPHEEDWRAVSSNA